MPTVADHFSGDKAAYQAIICRMHRREGSLITRLSNISSTTAVLQPERHSPSSRPWRYWCGGAPEARGLASFRLLRGTGGSLHIVNCRSTTIRTNLGMAADTRVKQPWNRHRFE